MMMTLRILLATLNAQAGGPVTELHPIFDLYRAFAEGSDGSATDYGCLLSESRLAELKMAQRGPIEDPVLPVAIDARGRFELVDGHHRAVRMVLEGRTHVDVEVVRVSALWQRFVDDTASLYPDRLRFIYQPIEHPWFDGWTIDRSAERLGFVLQAVKDRTNPLDGSALDIGCCTGRFVRDMSRAGWVVYGADRDADALRVAEYLDLAFGVGARYCLTSTPEKLLDAGFGWSAVLCLSVFHRAIAAGEHEFVGRLYRRCMERSVLFVVDSASPTDTSVQPSPIPLDAESFRAWLLSIAPSWKQVDVIGETEGRTVYSCYGRP